jgi:hypothetical protein
VKKTAIFKKKEINKNSFCQPGENEGTPSFIKKLVSVSEPIKFLKRDKK